jgi:bifunctional DNA-binding transcriptional regulator/antitoxin component of YhaV-PrlF toxin-antitoxin module
MKNNSLALSSKYQVVIPKAARQKMGLDKAVGQRLRVTHVTKDEIVFRKEPPIEDFLGAFGDVFPKNATALLRKVRDEDRG